MAADRAPNPATARPRPRVFCPLRRAAALTGLAAGLGATESTLVLERAGAAWHLYLYAALALALAWLAWRRYGPAAAGAWGFLGRCCRVAALVAIVAVLAGPAILTVTSIPIPGKLLLAVDRSASMARPDGPGGAPRLAQADALDVALAARGLGERVQRVGLHGSSPGWQGSASSPADGIASPLAESLGAALTASRAKLAVLVSDARSTGDLDLVAAADSLRRHGTPVWVLLAGGDTVDRELRLVELDGPREAVLGERQTYRAVIATRALRDAVKLELRLGSRVLASAEAPQPLGGDGVQSVELRADLAPVFTDEGEQKLTLVARAEGREALLERSIRVIQRRLTVLLLGHRPRYELRYLREALRRDRTITCHAYLADGRWRRWGEDGPDRLPLTPGDLRAYDAIIIGDIPAESLRPSEQEAIEEAVRARGAGVIWLPGETGAIAGFRGTRLGGLLSAELPDAGTLAAGYLEDRPRRLRRTAAAEARLLLDAGNSLAWEDLPLLRGAAALGRLRANAVTLAEDDRGAPLVVAAESGAGRSVLIAIDDTWRWRRRVGDTFLHRFHSQLLRWAAGNRLLGRRPWQVEALPRATTPGAPVTLAVVPTAPGDPEASLPAEVTLRLSAAGAERLVRLPRQGSEGWRLRLPAPPLGAWTVSISDGLRSTEVAPTELQVDAPAAEARDPRADRPAAEALAQATGGRVFTDPQALVDALPELDRSEERRVRTPLWDQGWILLLIVALLAADWAIRRAHRLP
jgi:hypothetical protein